MILAYFHNDGADDDGFIRVLRVDAVNNSLTSSDKFYFNGDPGSIKGAIYITYDPDTSQIALIYADADNSNYGTTRMYKPGYNDSNFRRFIGTSLDFPMLHTQMVIPLRFKSLAQQMMLNLV